MDKDKYSALLFIMIPSILDYYKNGNEISDEDELKYGDFDYPEVAA